MSSKGPDRLLRDIEKIEQTLRFWIRTGTPINSDDIERMLNGPLGFVVRVPRGGSSHKTLTHPSGQIVGLVSGTRSLDYQIAAAKAGLAVVNILRQSFQSPVEKSPDPLVKPRLDSVLHTLNRHIPDDFSVEPVEGFEKSWIVRSSAFPQVAEVVYEGMRPDSLAQTIETMLETQTRIKNFLEQADTLEFNTLNQNGTIQLTHRVHRGVDCILEPCDPLSTQPGKSALECLEDFEKRIVHRDEEAERKRTTLLNGLVGYRESAPVLDRDGYAKVPCSFLNPLTNETYAVGYTRSPAGRIDPESFLQMFDGVYSKVFATLKKDASRLYGLNSTQREKGILRIAHPYFKKLNMEIFDLRAESLSEAYRKSSHVDDLSPRKWTLFEEKLENISRILSARNQAVEHISVLSREFNDLTAYTAQKTSLLKIHPLWQRQSGAQAGLLFSYGTQEEERYSLEVIVRDFGVDEVQPHRDPNAPRMQLAIIPKPESLVGLFEFIQKGREHLFPDQSKPVPFPAYAMRLKLENGGHVLPEHTVILPPVVI
ncbi:MAG TPA: hypothetical protein PKX87_02785 [Alphaproteobacteria bacterium]|nr:hypothetical protein [Alphaproteobacteria bacterium]